MPRALSSRDANSQESAQFLHERFSGFGQNTLVIHKTGGDCSKSSASFVVSRPCQTKGNSGTATISVAKINSMQLALVHSAHIGEKIANSPNNCASEFERSRGAHACGSKNSDRVNTRCFLNLRGPINEEIICVSKSIFLRKEKICR